jgi:serine/threonine-protein kinase
VELRPGAVFGVYRIEAPLARGGMGAVYRAYEASLDRRVALKVLPAELLHETGFAERFQREARLAARLEHPHIVPIHAYGIEDGHPWMALRLITGGALADLVQRGRLDPARTVAILRDVADALDHAHRSGVIHRDVKPQNVLLDEEGRAYLADFGIARMLESSSHITATGMIQGTPAYMAPEQAEGKTLGPPCDIYALGVVAYQCMVGRVPFSGTPVSVLVQHVNTPPPLPGRDELKPSLTAVLHRCLAKDPDARWPSADAFVSALDRARRQEGAETLTHAASGAVSAASAAGPTRDVTSPPGSSRRALFWAGLAAAAAIVIAVGAVGLWWMASGRSPDTTPLPRETVAQDSTTPEPTTVPTPAATPARPPATPRATPTATPLPTPSPTPLATPPPREAAPVVVAAEPETAPTPEPPPPDVPSPAASMREGPIRVFFEAHPESRLFDETKAKDVKDTVRDLTGALDDADALVLAESRSSADAVIEVLERGKKKVLGLPTTRQVRIRVTAGGHSIELVGQDKALGFNTWKGAAKGALRDAEAWLEATLRPAEPE